MNAEDTLLNIQFWATGVDWRMTFLHLFVLFALYLILTATWSLAEDYGRFLLRRQLDEFDRPFPPYKLDEDMKRMLGWKGRVPYPKVRPRGEFIQ